MQDFGLIILAVINLAKTSFTIWGFTFSFWQLFLFLLVLGLVAWFIREAFD